MHDARRTPDRRAALVRTVGVGAVVELVPAQPFEHRIERTVERIASRCSVTLRAHPRPACTPVVVFEGSMRASTDLRM